MGFGIYLLCGGLVTALRMIVAIVMTNGWPFNFTAKGLMRYILFEVLFASLTWPAVVVTIVVMVCESYKSDSSAKQIGDLCDEVLTDVYEDRA